MEPALRGLFKVSKHLGGKRIRDIKFILGNIVSDIITWT